MRMFLTRWLRWSESFLKTDMVYLTKGGFWLFLGQGLTMGVTFLSAVAFANLMPAELYGNYKYVLSVVGVIGALTLTGLGSAVTRSVARGHEGTFAESYRMTLRWSVGMVIAAAIAGTYYLVRGNEVLGSSFLIAGACLPFISASSLFRPFLMGKKKFQLVSVLGLLQNLLPALATISTLWISTNVILLVVVYFVSQVIVYEGIFRFVRTHYVENSISDPVFERLGKHLSVMNVMSTIAQQLGNVLVFQLLGGTELAILTFATAIPDLVRASLKNIAALAVPRFAARSKDELKQGFIHKSIIVFVVTAGMAIGYILIVPWFFALFFPKYLASVPYTQVYGVTIALSMILSGAYLESQVAIKEKYALNIFASVTTIITSFIGIHFFGLWGAIIARIIARILNITVSSLVVWRH